MLGGSLAPPALAVGVHADALAPLLLPEDLRLSPEQFAVVCAANPQAVLELTADGQLIHMTPTGGETGCRNTRLLVRLPDGSVLSPEASLLRQERWEALSPQERRGFPPLCPDLVVELASASDEGPRGLTALLQKMATYQVNGAQLGWLLIPHLQAVEIWPAAGQGEPQTINSANQLDAGPLFPGLRLELDAIWHV